jgi:hypothetical protein
MARTFDDLAKHHNIGRLKANGPRMVCFDDAPKDRLRPEEGDDL